MTLASQSRWLGTALVAVAVLFTYALTVPQKAESQDLPGDMHPLRIFAVGDTGSGNSNQKAVATAMAQRAKLYQEQGNPVKGILHLGDIVYPSGRGDHVDALVHQMYQPLATLDVPFYFSLGNHDVLTRDGKDILEALLLPQDTYYAQSFSPMMDTFAINTSTFSADAKQQQWLKHELSKSKARWQLVFGHHPLYSTGAHGHDTELVTLRKMLEPILIEYGVEVYLSGHDHNYERFAHALEVGIPETTIPYLHVVSGGGGAYLRDKRRLPKPGSPFPKTMAYNNTKYHYLDATVSPCAFQLKARGTDGKAFDDVTVKHPECQSAYSTN